jgi:NAD-dependent dihydropyrimidine dehydrogenase PreA subunit
MYIDENLCTGCGLCLDACAQRAISLEGNCAVIDVDICAGCGRCAPFCMTGAIGSAEIVPPVSLSLVPGRYDSPQVRPGTSPALVALEASRPSRLETVEKVMSGVFGVLDFVLSRKQPSGSLSKGASILVEAGQCGGRRRGTGRGAGYGGRGRNYANRCRAGK